MVSFSTFNVLREKYASAVIVDNHVPVAAGTEELNKIIQLFNFNKNTLSDEVFARAMDDWCAAIFRAQPPLRDAWRTRHNLPLSDEEQLVEIGHTAQIAMYMAVGEIRMLAMDTSAYDPNIIRDARGRLDSLIEQIREGVAKYRRLQLDIMEAERVARRDRDVAFFLERAEARRTASAVDAQFGATLQAQGVGVE